MFEVITRENIHHSEHASYRDAVLQSELIHGSVLCPTGLSDREAWEHAKQNQGFTGDFSDWQAQDDEERNAYEQAAQ